MPEPSPARSHDAAAAPPGAAGLEVALVDGLSAAVSVRSRSPMKLLTPLARGQSVWAYTSSFGGGMVAGDQTRLDLDIGPGARCHVGSQASTKIYRNPEGRPCGHTTHARIHEGALLSLTPDPVQAFAGARYRQHQEFDLARGASLVLVDALSSGRTACGERWEFQAYHSRTLVRQEGRLCFMDALALDGGAGPIGGSHRVGAYNGIASLLLMGESVAAAARAMVAEIQALPVNRQAPVIRSASELEGGCLVRLMAVQIESILLELRRLLAFLCPLLGDDPWTRKW